MMGDHGAIVLGADIEDQPVARKLELEAIGPLVMSNWRERVLLHQIVYCDRAFVFDVSGARGDTVLIEDDLDEALSVCARAHRRLILVATERAWAASPSASPSVMTAGPSCASWAGPHLRIEVRFTKSSTPNPDENRAERAVGST